MQNLELENSILSCMIIDSKCSIEWNLLTKEDFTNNININIFEAIQSLVQNNKPVDYLSDLRKSGQIEYDADLVIFVHR